MKGPPAPNPRAQITGVGTETPLPVLVHVLCGWAPQPAAFVLKAFGDYIISVDGGEDAGLA